MEGSIRLGARGGCELGLCRGWCEFTMEIFGTEEGCQTRA